MSLLSSTKKLLKAIYKTFSAKDKPSQDDASVIQKLTKLNDKYLDLEALQPTTQSS